MTTGGRLAGSWGSPATPLPATVFHVLPRRPAQDQEHQDKPRAALRRQRGEMGKGTGHVQQDGQQVKGSK